MRVVLGSVLVAAVAYGGYWFVGSHMFRKGAEDWFAAQQAEGLVAEREALSVTGFPSRFDLTVTAPHIADPQTGWGWRAPFAQIFALSYNPTHVIFALPDDQVVETPLGDVAVAATGLKGSVRVGLDLAPVRTAATGESIRATLPDGEALADSFRWGSRVTEGAIHEVALEIAGLGLTAPGVDLRGGSFTANGTVTLAPVVADLPVDERPVEMPLDALSLTQAVLRFGDVSVQVSGDVTADADGFAAGQMLLRVEDWPAALDAAVKAGLIPENRAETLEGGFRMMANGDAVEMPLTLADGVVRFGPLPLANAPRLK
ncbi:DUF2125 domain-containing protein [Falsirhodobacter xinxiangensis]|uniref:DUF2125 domain-containing protein n=1 Tax=Falsirhodobacter xinxiangensis TaxID=2530049 RepID=UPI0010AAC79A|nr:DUF2125 domain-containing protein [Rhodobacter xinxiangensis]